MQFNMQMNISNYLIHTMQFTSKHTHASNYLTCTMQFNVNIAQGKLTNEQNNLSMENVLIWKVSKVC